MANNKKRKWMRAIVVFMAVIMFVGTVTAVWGSTALASEVTSGASNTESVAQNQQESQADTSAVASEALQTEENSAESQLPSESLELETDVETEQEVLATPVLGDPIEGVYVRPNEGDLKIELADVPEENDQYLLLERKIEEDGSVGYNFIAVGAIEKTEEKAEIVLSWQTILEKTQEEASDFEEKELLYTTYSSAVEDFTEENFENFFAKITAETFSNIEQPEVSESVEVTSAVTLNNTNVFTLNRYIAKNAIQTTSVFIAEDEALKAYDAKGQEVVVEGEESPLSGEYTVKATVWVGDILSTAENPGDLSKELSASIVFENPDLKVTDIEKITYIAPTQTAQNTYLANDLVYGKYEVTFSVTRVAVALAEQEIEREENISPFANAKHIVVALNGEEQTPVIAVPENLKTATYTLVEAVPYAGGTLKTSLVSLKIMQQVDTGFVPRTNVLNEVANNVELFGIRKSEGLMFEIKVEGFSPQLSPRIYVGNPTINGTSIYKPGTDGGSFSVSYGADYCIIQGGINLTDYMNKEGGNIGSGQTIADYLNMADGDEFKVNIWGIEQDNSDPTTAEIWSIDLFGETSPNSSSADAANDWKAFYCESNLSDNEIIRQDTMVLSTENEFRVNPHIVTSNYIALEGQQMKVTFETTHPLQESNLKNSISEVEIISGVVSKDVTINEAKNVATSINEYEFTFTVPEETGFNNQAEINVNFKVEDLLGEKIKINSSLNNIKKTGNNVNFKAPIKVEKILMYATKSKTTYDGMKDNLGNPQTHATDGDNIMIEIVLDQKIDDKNSSLKFCSKEVKLVATNSNEDDKYHYYSIFTYSSAGEWSLDQSNNDKVLPFKFKLVGEHIADTYIPNGSSSSVSNVVNVLDKQVDQEKIDGNSTTAGYFTYGIVVKYYTPLSITNWDEVAYREADDTKSDPRKIAIEKDILEFTFVSNREDLLSSGGSSFEIAGKTEPSILSLNKVKISDDNYKYIISVNLDSLELEDNDNQYIPFTIILVDGSKQTLKIKQSKKEKNAKTSYELSDEGKYFADPSATKSVIYYAPIESSATTKMSTINALDPNNEKIIIEGEAPATEYEYSVVKNGDTVVVKVESKHKISLQKTYATEASKIAGEDLFESDSNEVNTEFSIKAGDEFDEDGNIKNEYSSSSTTPYSYWEITHKITGEEKAFLTANGQPIEIPTIIPFTLFFTDEAGQHAEIDSTKSEPDNANSPVKMNSAKFYPAIKATDITVENTSENRLDPKIARKGDTITITFQTNHKVLVSDKNECKKMQLLVGSLEKQGKLTKAGGEKYSVMYKEDENIYEVTFEVPEDVTIDNTEIPFVLVGQDAAGNTFMITETNYPDVEATQSAKGTAWNTAYYEENLNTPTFSEKYLEAYGGEIFTWTNKSYNELYKDSFYPAPQEGVKYYAPIILYNLQTQTDINSIHVQLGDTDPENKISLIKNSNGDDKQIVEVIFSTTHPIDASAEIHLTKKEEVSAPQKIAVALSGFERVNKEEENPKIFIYKLSYELSDNAHEDFLDNKDLEIEVVVSDKAGNDPVTGYTKDAPEGYGDNTKDENLKGKTEFYYSSKSNRVRYYAPIEISNVKVVSNNQKTANTVAKNGDIITVTFNTNHPVTVDKSTLSEKGFTLSAQNEDSTQWYGTFVVSENLTEDTKEILLYLLLSDKVEQTAEVDPNSYEKVSYYAPIALSDVVITSNNRQSSTQYAKDEDQITVTFNTNHLVEMVSASIAQKGATVTKVEKNGNTSPNESWVMTYTLANGDLKDLEEVPFALILDDIAGNGPVQKNNTDTDVTNKIKYYAPIEATTSIASNNTRPEYMKNGETVTITNIAQHEVSAESASIFGRDASSSGNGSEKVEVSYAVPAGESTLVEGPVSFSLALIDPAGNTLPVSETNDAPQSSVIYDRTAPEVSISPGFVGFTNQDVTMTYIYTDTNLDASGVSLNINNVSQGGVSKTSEFSYSLPITLSEEGYYFLEGQVTDLAGNVSETTAKVSFVIDKTIPVVTLSDIDLGGKNTYKGGFSLNEIFNVDEDYVKEVLCTLTDSTGVYDWSIDTPIEKDGKKTVFISATDMAGNASIGMSYDFYVDGTAPKPEVVFAENGQTLSVGENKIVSRGGELTLDLAKIHIGDEEPDHFTKIQLLDKKGNVVKDLVKENSYENSGSYTIPLEKGDFGEYTLLIEASDDVGNKTDEMKYEITFKDLSWWQKFYQNKPLFYGTIAAVVLIGAGTAFFVYKRKKSLH